MLAIDRKCQSETEHLSFSWLGSPWPNRQAWRISAQLLRLRNSEHVRNMDLLMSRCSNSCINLSGCLRVAEIFIGWLMACFGNLIQALVSEPGKSFLDFVGSASPFLTTIKNGKAQELRIYIYILVATRAYPCTRARSRARAPPGPPGPGPGPPPTKAP